MNRLPYVSRRHIVFGSTALVAAPMLLAGAPAAAQSSADALASWNDGPSKKSITDFVARVTAPATTTSCRPSSASPCFDNDGTLWCEQPIYFQVAFALDRVKAMAPKHPEWKDKQPFKAAAGRRHAAVMASGEKGAAGDHGGHAHRHDHR